MSKADQCECPHAHKIHSIEQRLDAGDETLEGIPGLIKEMTRLADEVATLSREMGATREIVSAWGNIKGFGKTMKLLSAVLKTCAIIGTACATLYYLFVHNTPAAQDIVTKLKNN